TPTIGGFVTHYHPIWRRDCAPPGRSRRGYALIVDKWLELSMPTQMRLTAPAAIAGLLTLLVFTNPSAAPAQAAECLAAPNGAAPRARARKGALWSYGRDRVRGRSGWYVGPEAAPARQTAGRRAPQAQPPATQPPATSAPAASAPPQVMSAPPQVITPPPAPR